MSGPKKADVKQVLDEVWGLCTQAKQALAVGTVDALTSQLQTAESSVANGKAAAVVAEEVAARLVRDLGASLPDAAAAATADASGATKSVDGVRAALAAAQAAIVDAARANRQAGAALADVEREVQVERRRLRSASDHYLHDHMRRAEELKPGAESARSAADAAKTSAKRASLAVAAAVKAAHQAAAGAQSARARATAAHAAGLERKRAIEEAKRIAEARRRAAVEAQASAQAARSALASVAHGKFAPGVLAQVDASMAAAAAGLGRSDWQVAEAAADAARRAADTAVAGIGRAQAEFDARKAAAAAAVQAAQADAAAVDANLLADWADDGQALAAVRSRLARVTEAMDAERFEQAEAESRAAADLLEAALASAIGNHEKHIRREHIAQAVQDALRDLGFDVSYEHGTRSTPALVSGQTPDVAGKGDFDIHIPLDGDLDFTVESPAGDASCVAAVNGLQGRLRQMGIAWETTNWGHATGAVAPTAVPTPPPKDGSTIKTGVHVTSTTTTQTRVNERVTAPKH